MNAPRPSALLTALLTALLGSACAFDDSRLASLARCDGPEDCAGGGPCVEGYCVGDAFGPFDLAAPQGPGSADATDRSPYDGADTGVEADGEGADVEAADMAADAADTPDGPAFDLPAADLPAADTLPGDLTEVHDEPACANPNACGGCGPLLAAPGDPCSSAPCGVYACEGPTLLRCVERPVNPCGGCTVLGGQPGEACGDCGGQLACDGAEGLLCDGDAPNACGGCGGPSGLPGDACGCPGVLLDEDHALRCAGDVLRCSDANDDLASATPLPDTNDVMSAAAIAAGALVDGEGVDWFVVRVADVASGDGMFPDVRLTGLSANHDLCAWFMYQAGGTPAVDCASGQKSTLGDLEGCCSSAPGTADELVRLRNGAWWTDRFDTRTGGGNDDGILYVRVTGGPFAGCAPYRLEYRF
jgi:hypothetical protein